MHVYGNDYVILVIPKEVTKPTTTSTPMPISSKMTTSADSTMHTTMSEEPVKEGLDCTAEANIGAHGKSCS